MKENQNFKNTEPGWKNWEFWSFNEHFLKNLWNIEKKSIYLIGNIKLWQIFIEWAIDWQKKRNLKISEEFRKLKPVEK